MLLDIGQWVVDLMQPEEVQQSLGLVNKYLLNLIRMETVDEELKPKGLLHRCPSTFMGKVVSMERTSQGLPMTFEQ
ncbi:hypothetical protein E5288_WYG014842 [Bos mutus]|uniref:Uncharacterized protein n=1 Tax=Bos mutus TaxID=72004 RepID=A0A6B0S1D5_9CETA|nr:hypothetical protein [Bos mutus]